MHKLLQLLCCPKCGADVTSDKSIENINCNSCEASYPIINGIISFNIEAFENSITAKAFSEQWDGYNKGQFESNTVFGLSEDDYINHFCYAFNIKDIENFDGLILEVGVGSGHLIHALAKVAKKATIIGMDISDNLYSLAYLTEKFENLYLIQADLLNPPIKQHSIEYIYTSGVLHHTENTFKSVKSLWNLVANNGEFYFWIYPSYSFCAYDKLRNILGKPYKFTKRTRKILSKLFAPILWTYFFTTKNYSYKDSLENLSTISFRIFDNISPEFQHRTSKKEIKEWCKEIKIDNYQIINDLGILCINKKKND